MRKWSDIEPLYAMICLNYNKELKIRNVEYFSYYKKWHTLLEDYLKCFDVDLVEVRQGKVVALFELKESFETEDKIKSIKPSDILADNTCSFQLKYLKDMASKLDVNAYLVIHTFDLTFFRVYDIKNDKIIDDFNREQYRIFLGEFNTKK